MNHELLFEKEHLSSLVRLLPVGVSWLRKDLTYVQVNEWVGEFTGTPLSEFPGKPFGFTNGTQGVRERMQEFMASERGYDEFEAPFRRRDTALRRMRVYLQKIRGGEELLLITVDIEGQVRAIEELRQEREFHQRILDSIQDPIFVKGEDSHWTYANKAMSELLGLPREELIGKSDFDLFPKEMAEAFRTTDELALALKRAQETEEVIRGTGGEGRIIVTQKTPVVKDGSRILVGVIRDVTERRRQEAQLAHSAQLASLGEMAGGVAHEMSNPLAVVDGIVTAILNDFLSGIAPSKEELVSDLRNIKITVERIAKIVHGMRSLSQSERNKVFEATELDALIEETLSVCRERFAGAGIRVTVSALPGCKPEVNPMQMGQAILNLLINAFDAIKELPKERKWVTVRTARSGENEVEISVVDGGDGIPREIASKIMLPFFTTKPIGSGTGMGLSITKNIVENHGGRLELDPTAENTTFVIRIPLKQKKGLGRGDDAQKVA